jgi:hypothetical protein
MINTNVWFWRKMLFHRYFFLPIAVLIKNSRCYFRLLEIVVLPAKEP